MPAAGRTRYDKHHRAMRPVVFARDNWTCHWCGRTVTEDIAELDHVVALIDGGTNHPSNYVCACASCNRTRGGRLGNRRRARAERLNPSRSWL